MNNTSYMFCGKGGVGKSTCAASCALQLSKTTKTLLIDYDGGRSLQRILHISKDIVPNHIHKIAPKLSLVNIQNVPYPSIEEFRKTPGNDTKKYLKSFHDDYGVIAYFDMGQQFFGFPIDIQSFQKFVTLACILHEAKLQGIQNIVIDVEPTSGLEKLLSLSEKTLRSLGNLKKNNALLATAIRLTMPDVYQFIKGDYVKNIDTYIERIRCAVKVMKHATYYVVCTPEDGPTLQVQEVTEIIQLFGGTICGYIVNRIQQQPAAYEVKNIERIKSKGLPTIMIKNSFDIMGGTDSMMDSLHAIGETILTA